MKQIRHNVFETNSSSVHSITMCMKSDYDAWCNGEVWFLNRRLPKGKTSPFFTWDEVVEFLKSYEYGPSEEELMDILELKENNSTELEEALVEYEFYSLDSYEYCNSDYEHYCEEFTTPSGERVVSFGYSGASY